MGNRHSRAACFPELDQESTHTILSITAWCSDVLPERLENVLRMFSECSENVLGQFPDWLFGSNLLFDP